MIDKNNIGAVSFTRLDTSIVRLNVKFLAAVDAYRIQEAVGRLDGKPIDDPATQPDIAQILEGTISGWDRPDAFSIDVMMREFSPVEISQLAIIAADAASNIERGMIAARGGRKLTTDAAGAPAYGFADEPPAAAASAA